MDEITRLLLSDMPLAISESGYRYLLAIAYPKAYQSQMSDIDILQTRATDQQGSPQPYCKQTETALTAIMASSADVRLTAAYSATDVPEGSVAYHRIFGTIIADSWWRFSTKQLEANLLAAEANPRITAHLLHINSPGGEAYYLDRLGETMDTLLKPVIAVIEEACSAAYHIACHARAIYATTQFDLVGCIGTMVSFYDFSEFFTKNGIRRIEAKADQSDLKNKTVEELIDGKPRKFIDTVLNPMNEAFVKTVRSHRAALAKVPDDAPALRGETFFTDEAKVLGLIDGRMTLAEAAAEAARLGAERIARERLLNQIYEA